MALCTTVSILASQVEMQLDNLKDSHSNMLAVMKNMPAYLEAGDLAQWEEDYRRAITDDDDEDESHPDYQVIDLVYELAGLNLFGKFDQDESLRVYRLIVKQMKGHGIEVSGGLDVSDW